MCVKHLFAKHAFLGDLGECHHLEIATLRLYLGSGGVFVQSAWSSQGESINSVLFSGLCGNYSN